MSGDGGLYLLQWWAAAPCPAAAAAPRGPCRSQPRPSPAGTRGSHSWSVDAQHVQQNQVRNSDKRVQSSRLTTISITKSTGPHFLEFLVRQGGDCYRKSKVSMLHIFYCFLGNRGIPSGTKERRRSKSKRDPLTSKRVGGALVVDAWGTWW